MHIQNILVVCVGNICRSPMAEYLLKQHAELQVESAGVAGLIGQSADPKAIICMDQLNIDIRPHIAKKLNVHSLKNADLVLVMTENQQKYIEQQWPFSKGKVFRLGHWQNLDIADPYQQGQPIFNTICQQIQSCLQDWQPYLQLDANRL